MQALKVARIGPFEKLTSLFLRQECTYSEATLLRETDVGVVLKVLQHLSSSTEICEVVLPLNARSPDSP